VIEVGCDMYWLMSVDLKGSDEDEIYDSWYYEEETPDGKMIDVLSDAINELSKEALGIETSPSDEVLMAEKLMRFGNILLYGGEKNLEFKFLKDH